MWFLPDVTKKPITEEDRKIIAKEKLDKEWKEYLNFMGKRLEFSHKLMMCGIY